MMVNYGSFLYCFQNFSLQEEANRYFKTSSWFDAVGRLIQFLDNLDPRRPWHSMWQYEKWGRVHEPIWWCSLNLYSINKTSYYAPDRTKKNARVKLAEFIVDDLKASSYDRNEQWEYRCFLDLDGKVRVLARDSTGRVVEAFGKTGQEAKSKAKLSL